MSNKSNYVCPECGSPIKAWADLDAQVSFVISKAGKLTKRVITNNYQSDGRCGVNCTECDWELHVDDLDSNSPLKTAALDALERQSMIDELSAKR
ncbi:TPA: hypothetical protein L3310_002623 [Vibrio cholerae]|nr:hypothetical protein [Vibrio cholerae]HBN6885657.1 hypothetical protein [Vibrio cholerae]HBN6897419.1 hypothetical protein [Vibrio cholerae]HDI3249798.1 hypothetical protein [Vibrio cholerae]